jgi:flavin-dependent dehydrogenase
VKIWDVAVLGAGPAGALVARCCARSGHSVLLLDRDTFPRWKVCGACLSPGAHQALERAGLATLVPQCGGVRLESLTLRAGPHSSSIELRGSAALSRSALDHALVRAAIASGVEFRPGVRAQLGPREGEVTSVLMTTRGARGAARARVVVDATGLGGVIDPRQATDDGVTGGSVLAHPDSRIGVGAVFDHASYDVAPGELQMTVGAAGYVGVVRLEDGSVNVGAALDKDIAKRLGPGGAVDEILSESGREPLSGFPVQGWRGTPLLTRRRDRLAYPNFFRVGDAAGYVEPFTGEGMSWALTSALALAPLVTRAQAGWHDSLARAWEAYHRRHVRPSQRLCRGLARGLRHPMLVRSIVGVLQRAPALARPFVHAVGRPPGGEAAA